MRAWCFRHPTLTLLALVAWYVAWCFIAGHFMLKGGWWIALGIGCLAVTSSAREQLTEWWRRT